jgi:uncharacterized sulfatase
VWAKPPNILFILTDDQGWPTLGCYGSRQVPTPHLDQLAQQGQRYAAAYVTPQCTPTRGALLTGQHPARSRLWHVIPWYGSPWAPVAEPAFAEQLPRTLFTVAKGLRAAGYATACMGKWHLTTNSDGDYASLRADAATHYGFEVVSTPGVENHKTGDKQVTHLTNEAIAFIDKNHDRPWFCYLAHHTVHGVVSAPAPLVAKHRAVGAPADGLHNATYLAALAHLDDSVGRLMQALEQRQLRERTLVVFLSDNGGVNYAYDIQAVQANGGQTQPLTVKTREFDNAPLRGTKGTLYEGGIRVPCLARWPGQIAAGSVCATPIQVTDWLPTLLAVAGTSAPATHPIDDTDLRPLWTGQNLPERALVWYAPLYDLRWGATPAAAIRQGEHKLLEFFGDSFAADGTCRPGARVELYDVSADLGETRDLSATQPATVARLRTELHRFLRSVSAEIPGPNPHHDPKRPFLETKHKPQR